MERRRLYAAINPALLAPLGEVTVYFNLLTQTISMGIWFLMGGASLEAQHVGRIITSELSFRGLVNVYCSLYRYRFQDRERLAAVDGLRKRLEKAEEKRNTVSHSMWGAAPTPGKSTRIKATAKARKGWTPEFQEMSASDLQVIADEFAALASDLQDETFRALGWMPSTASG